MNYEYHSDNKVEMLTRDIAVRLLSDKFNPTDQLALDKLGVLEYDVRQTGYAKIRVSKFGILIVNNYSK